MFCPRCRSEYNPGAKECSDCGVPLVEFLPDQDDDGALDLVSVLETSDASKALLARSLLEEAGIPFIPRGEQLQDLFGLGRLVPVNPISGPVVFQVRRDDADDAREILAILVEEDPESEDSPR